MGSVTVGVVGCGYWGPNLLRNFTENEGASLTWICELDPQRLATVARKYPLATPTTDVHEMLADANLQAIVIATPVSTHYSLARMALEAGKHVLIEKPFTATSAEAKDLIERAERAGLTVMVDHIFVYTGAVQKIKQIVDNGELGELLYFDSIRINLGLFQRDKNVIWDLAPHDLSIMDYVVARAPKTISAVGSSHIERGIENIAYLILKFHDDFIAHFHFNWLSPVKIRRALLAGSRKMIVYDDIEPTEKIRVYDKGVTMNTAEIDRETGYKALVSYRAGDVWVPKLDSTEALNHVCKEFLASINDKRKPLTGGEAGLNVVRYLEAAQESISNDGKTVVL
jgi:predicted dehydrogenase